MASLNMIVRTMNTNEDATLLKLKMCSCGKRGRSNNKCKKAKENPVIPSRLWRKHRPQFGSLMVFSALSRASLQQDTKSCCISVQIRSKKAADTNMSVQHVALHNHFYEVMLRLRCRVEKRCIKNMSVLKLQTFLLTFLSSKIWLRGH